MNVTIEKWWSKIKLILWWVKRKWIKKFRGDEKMNGEKLTKKDIIEVFEKLQIPIEEKNSGKFEVWEMEPMKRSTKSFINTY